jgi:uncharacterized membrane protein YraQ (UPF0718 family)
MLGPFMAIIRPIAAITSAIVAGLIVGRDGDTQNGETSSPTDDCCHSAQTVSHSCDTGANSSSETSISDQLKAGLRFTYLDLVKDIAVWLIIGLGCAALIKTYVPNEFLLQWGDGLLAFVIMAVIGVPMYICATASTPIAAGLLFSGVSPGATLVFMLVGPATNIATMGLVKNELGNRILAIYLISVVAVGFAFGYLTNYLAALWAMDFLAQAHNAHNMINTGVAQTSGIILAGLMAYGIAQKYLPKMTHA